LGEDFEGGVGVAGVFGTEGLDEFGGALDFVGEVALLKITAERTEAEFKIEAFGTRLRGGLNDVAIGEAGVEPVVDGLEISERQIGDAFVGTGRWNSGKIIWNRWNCGGFLICEER
jgi:hypothetical protein